MTVQLVIDEGLHDRLIARAASVQLNVEQPLEAVARDAEATARVAPETLASIDRQIATSSRLFARLAE